MLSDDLRRRLEKLNRGPLKIRDDAPTRPTARRKIVPLDEVVQGEVVDNDMGSFLRVARPAEQFLESWSTLVDDHAGLFRAGATMCMLDGLGDDLACLADHDPREITYLDLETCGLSGQPLFLVGLLHVEDDRLLVDQLFARNYAEEAAVLCHLHEHLSGRRMVVTFNGKSFDWPFVRDRSYVAGLRPEDPERHVDLLHESRRIFGKRFGNCKLQTLETALVNRIRRGDIPGSLIPKVYHDFVRSGNAMHIEGILHHNALDLVTMADIVVKLLEGKR